jgi:hypothetical protein
MSSKYLAIALIILALSAVLLLLDNFIKKKQATSSAPKWRLFIGIVELTIAIAAFIWLSGYAISIIFRIGIVILGIAGIGEIMIGILNLAAKRTAKN